MVHPSANSYVSFSELVREPYVKIDLNASLSDFQPLDIAWVEQNKAGYSYHHVGVYLGNNQVCHMTKKNNGVRITGWSGFLEGQTRQYLYRFHPIIPFKNYQDIIRQAL